MDSGGGPDVRGGRDVAGARPGTVRSNIRKSAGGGFGSGGGTGKSSGAERRDRRSAGRREIGIENASRGSAARVSSPEGRVGNTAQRPARICGHRSPRAGGSGEAGAHFGGIGERSGGIDGAGGDDREPAHTRNREAFRAANRQ